MSAADKAGITARKNYKRAGRRGLDLKKLQAVVDLLADGASLPESMHDHALSNNWANHREGHIAPELFDGSTTFWFPGLYDTILFSKGQLKRMTRYILRNAARRWAVMQTLGSSRPPAASTSAPSSQSMPAMRSGSAYQNPTSPPYPRPATLSAITFSWTTPTSY